MVFPVKVIRREKIRIFVIMTYPAKKIRIFLPQLLYLKSPKPIITEIRLVTPTKKYTGAGLDGLAAKKATIRSIGIKSPINISIKAIALITILLSCSRSIDKKDRTSAQLQTLTSKTENWSDHLSYCFTTLTA